GTVGDVGGLVDLGAGILDRADQAGGGLRRLAHGDRRLFGGGGDLARLAEHTARRQRGILRLPTQIAALDRGVFDDGGDAVAEIAGQPLAFALGGPALIAAEQFDG